MNCLCYHHAVLWNDELSHHVAAADVAELLSEARKGFWRNNAASGAMLGARLYELFNGSGGHVERALQDVYHNGQPLTLIFRMPFELDALPIELLCAPGKAPHFGHLPEGEGDLLP